MESATISYFRRYSFPFVATAIPFPENDSHPSHTENLKIYNYILTPEELRNERPFMSGIKKLREAEISKRPIPSPIHVGDILSDEEIENERPFMRGRVKVPKEILKAKLEAKSNVHNVLSDEEWENEKPFMHGRTRIPKGHRRYLQIAPVLISQQQVNERPFMAGRNKLPKEVTGKTHQRQLVDLGSLGRAAGKEYSAGSVAIKKAAKVRTKRHLCPPCQVINDFRKQKLVPAVKNMQGFLTGRKTSASEKLINENDVDGTDKAKLLTTTKRSENENKIVQKINESQPHSHIFSSKAATKIFKEENLGGEQLKMANYKYID